MDIKEVIVEVEEAEGEDIKEEAVVVVEVAGMEIGVVLMQGSTFL